uniref:Uncharacterized protein n=1 Tax=Kalanchoe fedtschenkoi TaxID=63787 RepID=A0A7N0UGC4_KALFE
MKNSHNVCLPNLLIRHKTSNKSGNNKPIISTISLLDRLREAVLRLIMLAAVSKSASPASHNNSHHAHNLRQSYSSPSSRNDPHHSQAVAECIEFIKKKSAYGCVVDEDLESSGCDLSSCLDSPIVEASPQLGIALSVI